MSGPDKVAWWEVIKSCAKLMVIIEADNFISSNNINSAIYRLL